MTMKNMTIDTIIKVTGGTYYGSEEKRSHTITSVVTDSRKAVCGCLFIPLKGERSDGHDYIPAVIAEGALCVLSEHLLQDDTTYIQVASCAQALKDLAKFYREQLNCTIIGITGSVGKTSTKEMIASVLSEKYTVQKTAGNFNNEIGLPLTIFSIGEEHEIAVVEMGISDFGEMSRLAAIAQPDICVITNIGYCHLEFLKTRDGILKAKTECLEYIREGGSLILNGDDDKLVTITEFRGKQPCFYGIKETKGRMAVGHSVENLGLKGMKAVIDLGGESLDVRISIPGEHNVYNALAAACVGKLLNLSKEEITAGIHHATTMEGRNHHLEVGGVEIIDDCYNANPVSMKGAIDILGSCKGRTIAVLGDMGELGEDQEQLHYDVGVYLAKKEIHTLFCTGERSRQLAKGAIDKGTNTQVLFYNTKEDMTSDLCSFIKKGDTILVKASHFMKFETVITSLKETAVSWNQA
ncbi:MAG: UDP-N-acetylmuramoyl-tripeptide--D-alanyl-D-alanine ligase [Lachnospiraceae bacterium]